MSDYSISRDTGILIESNLIDGVYVLYILIMHALIYMRALSSSAPKVAWDYAGQLSHTSVSALEIILDICDVAMS